jgi:hypothetical protein
VANPRGRPKGSRHKLSESSTLQGVTINKRSRTGGTQFKPDQVANPRGRPKGSRHKL